MARTARISALKLITGPAVEPLSVPELRQRLALSESGGSDVALDALIYAARLQVERWLEGALITQTWELVLDEFPCDGEIEILLPPLQEVVSVTYTDADGAAVVIGAENYQVDTDNQPGWVVPVSSYSWPTAFSGINPVRIRFVAGYGDEGHDVPETIRSAIALMVGSMRAAGQTDPLIRSENIEGVGQRTYGASDTVLNAMNVQVMNLLSTYKPMFV